MMKLLAKKSYECVWMLTNPKIKLTIITTEINICYFTAKCIIQLYKLIIFYGKVSEIPS